MSPTLFDAHPDAVDRLAPVSYRCTAAGCRARVTIHVEHHHAPTCNGAGRHPTRPMERSPQK